MKFLLVFLGAGLGGGTRYWISETIQKSHSTGFPLGTLAVNIIGSFLLGFLIFRIDEQNITHANLKLLLGVGFCGGFTTFSTFSIETINLIHNSHLFLAAFNVIANIFCTLIGAYIGYLTSR